MAMISVGYMAKRMVGCPEWIKTPRVKEICSVGKCISADFADFINYWKHNGYWFFDSPQIIHELAQEHSIDLTGTRYFYYEAYEQEFDDTREQWQWTSFRPEPSFTTEIVVPVNKILLGYDVVTFSQNNAAECSPLSCNSLAEDVETNEHCLLSSLQQAQQLLESGKFKNSEPGPYRIFAVYSPE